MSSDLQLKCLVKGDNKVFQVKAKFSHEVSDLKELIQNKRAQGILKDIDPHSLELWKPNVLNPIAAKPDNTLVERTPMDLSEFAIKLDATDRVHDIFPMQPRGAYINIIVEVPRNTVSDESDNIFASLKELWNCAWGKPDSEATLFETREVIRDDTLPEATTPNKFRVLNFPGDALRKFSVSTILIRYEYDVALRFAIFVARGGKPEIFTEKNNASDDEEDNDPDLNSDEWITQLNPFGSYEAQEIPGFGSVGYVGHPGIGKTLFLFYVLTLRVLRALPSIYMVNPNCTYVVDAFGVRKVAIDKIDQISDVEKYWCLVDSNPKLTAVPDEIIGLGTFFMQTASPRGDMTEWWKKTNRFVTPFFLKEWSLSELIVGRTLQRQQQSASELQIKTFLDRYIPSAREVFNYAAHPFVYEARITKELSTLTREGIQKIIRNGKDLNFDGEVSPSHHIVLISPRTNRIEHRVEIPTRFIYNKLIILSKLHTLEAAFLLYEAFKEVKETKAPAGFIFEDLVQYQLPLGGCWPVVTMNKKGKKRKYFHYQTTGTEEGDTNLYLGKGGVPCDFATVSLSEDTFGELERFFYAHDMELVLRNGFYVPVVKNEATFDAFVYDANRRIATVFQVTVGKKHSVKNAGLAWLQKSGVRKVNYVAVTPVGQDLQLPFDPQWVSFLEHVYQLPLEFIDPSV